VGMINLAVLACIFKTTSKKGRHFLRKKVHPREKLATPMHNLLGWSKYCKLSRYFSMHEIYSPQ